ncbi:MAG: ABC transporter ATP-binding protein [Coriobacteriales bacterium]|jgi:ABC-type multidrug transport system ATPase subunit|nr:ABC transporter ATP-binding protein [Coriobacteriales bacterium]
MDGATLSVRSGEMVAVVGPNGAGKSTLFNIVAGVTTADAGACLLDDTPLPEVPLSSIGFLPEKPYFYQSFTARESIRFDQAMRGIEDQDKAIEPLIQHLRLSDFIDKRMAALSQGMAKRVALACALMGAPEVIVLDEPLNGLDIQSVITLKEQLVLHKQRGAHILISSHVLTFLDGLADKAVFLDKGRVVYESEGGSAREETYQQLFLE